MMSPILGASMPPPHTSNSDPYDIPASPMKALGKKESSSSRAGSKALTPARDSEADVEGSNDAASTEPEKEERNGAESGAKDDEDKADRHTPKDDEEEKPAQDKEEKPSETQKPAEAGPSRPAADADNGEVEIDKFEAHRINEENSTVDIQVLWVNGEKTWESEWSLQHQVPSLIYKYWDSLGGRDAITGLEVYHVFRILKRATPPRAKKNTFMYEVQWVGYRRTESSWEHETKIKEIAPDELIKYEAKNGAAEAQAQKRGVARAPGRPRKKAKTSDE